jgi:glycosyltransferase involved in cell wall biosynthesis
VFLGLREVAGYLWNLKQGFDEIGVESTLVNLAGHAFQYGEGRNPAWASRINRLAQSLGRRFPGGTSRRLVWIVISQGILGPWVFVRALFTHDVFIFTSMSSFFYFLDLPLLKLFRKTVLHVFLGSDSRPVYLNGYVLRHATPRAITAAIVLTRVQHTMLRIVERFADVIVNIPPQSHFHTRPIVSGYVIGMPMRDPTDGLDDAPDPPDPRAVRVLHAPSNPGPKGTDVVRATIEALRARGHAIAYVEITGRPNRDVIAAIQASDLVIDEVYSDTPMSGFAAEAASCGKPAVVGSYYVTQIRDVVPPDLMPPSAFCHPAGLEREVERLVVDPGLRVELGNRARAFLRDHWSARRVAAKFVLLIEGRCPPEWRFEPREIRYVHGCGHREPEARAKLRAFLARGGPRALCVGDKPGLQADLVAFARDGC